MQQFRPTVAEINLGHISHNIDVILKLAGERRFVCPMVKANAYGHGAVEVSRLLEKKGLKKLGVCILEEAFELISAGIKTDLLVFQSIDSKGLHVLLDESLASSPRQGTFNQIIPVISSMEQLIFTKEVLKDFWLRHQIEVPFEIQLKFDTGMNRFGFDMDSIDKVIEEVRGEAYLKLTGVASHLLQGEDFGEEKGRTSEQLIKFSAILDKFSGFDVEYHLFNSPAIARILNGHSDNNMSIGFRPGLMTYGYSSLLSDATGLKPAMTLKSKVSHFRNLEPGETVSYGGTWKAQRRSTIAIVPLGYADGVRRSLSNRSQVLVDGKLAPIIGSVCMDSFMVDVSEIRDQIPQNPQSIEVVLWGYSHTQKFLSAAEKANALQSHIWEVLTSPTYRVPRVFVGGDI